MKRFFLLLAVSIFFFNISFSQSKVKLACIAFYNTENFFDTIHNPGKNDYEFLPNGAAHWTSARYHRKLQHIAHVIAKIGTDFVPTGPIIMGLAEIEDRRVLEDLVKQPEIANRHYQIIHFEGPDHRGIDVALIYNPLFFRPLTAYPVHVPTPFPTRDILVVKGILDHSDTLTILVNHWPSRWGGMKRSEPYRDTAAATARKIIDTILHQNPKAKIILMGDLNDNPDNESVVKYLKAVGKKRQLKASPYLLYNPMYKKFKRGIGTTAYQDAWSLFDQLIISQGLLKAPDDTYKFYKAFVFNKPFLIQKEGRFEGYPFRTYAGGEYLGGYSDHLPVYMLLIKYVQ